MSKRELKKYLHELPKDQLEEQILDLYAKFKNVKTYFDFETIRYCQLQRWTNQRIAIAKICNDCS